MRQSAVFLLSVILIGAGVLAGCSSDDDPSPVDTGEAGDVEDTDDDVQAEDSEEGEDMADADEPDDEPDDDPNPADTDDTDDVGDAEDGSEPGDVEDTEGDVAEDTGEGEDTADLDEPDSPPLVLILDNTHEGWSDPLCLNCHTADPHNVGLAPYECTDCHGVNGASRGHTSRTPCARCHTAPHGTEMFPDPVSCQTCHLF